MAHRVYNRRAARRQAKFNAAFTKTTLVLCVFALGWVLGDATYFDADGFGFVTNFGGYHVSFLGDS